MPPPGKGHKTNKAGRKASKKDAVRKKRLGDVGASGMSAEQRNPKAFIFNSARKAQKQLARSADLEQRRFHAPLFDKSALDPPPYVVLVQGPPKVGKTTLIRCLVRHFSRQMVNEIQGPITVVAGKKRRLTFVECPHDMNGMIDAAKFADLVLLCVDASFGFEMETFEFLNLLQAHGFPKVMGVLTHLDAVTNITKLRKIKKQLKSRFWAEIYAGAKLFYLHGFRNRKYMHHEVMNLARFVSVMKMRPISWRTVHPYSVVDRFEDITPPESVRQDPKCDRNISLYGYLRGCNLRLNARVHVAGVGDYTLEEIDGLVDPCPFPEALKKRGLNEKERVMYAPMSNLGGFIYDKDAVYIDIPDWKVQFSTGGEGGQGDVKEGGEGEAMVKDLHNTQRTLDEKLTSASLKLFENGAALPGDMDGLEGDVSSGDDSDHDGLDNDEEDYNNDGDRQGKELRKDFAQKAFETVNSDGRIRRRVNFPDVDEEKIDLNEGKGGEESASSDDENYQEEMGRAGAWKEEMTARAATLFDERGKDLQAFIYGRKSTAEDETDDDDGGVDSCRVIPPFNVIAKWSGEGATSSLQNRFVSGDWDEGKNRSSSRPEASDEDGEGSSGSDVYGDFEDLETGEVFKGDDAAIDAARRAIGDVEAEERREKKKTRKAMFDEEYDKGGGGEGASGESEEEVEAGAGRGGKEQTYYDAVKEEMAEKWMRTRETLDSMSSQRRIALEGFQPGTYVRMKLKGVPYQMVECFDTSRPILVGGLGPGEDRQGCMRLRFKKHRWFPKILKTRDPLIFSLGWRRYQSMPIFAVEDHNRRIRMLKYTPEHTHCIGAVWGPISPSNSGFVAIQNLSSNVESWRISATGTVVEIEANFRIVKKLKLLGHPFKVQKNTAFVSGMFNSPIEVSRFEGASIRTVSGIRGTIKKAVRDGQLGAPKGTFRATFEDRVIKSDIVFLRSWATVEIPRFCNLVTDMLFKPERNDRAFVRRRPKDAEAEDLEQEDKGGEDVEMPDKGELGRDDLADFVPAPAFEGPKPGYCFKTGLRGLGYYRDSLVPLPVASTRQEQKKGDQSDEPSWKRMRTVMELRHERGIGAPRIADSEYRPIERATRKWLPMHIPRSLIADLPISSKPTLKSKSKDRKKAERRNVVIREPHEKKMATLLNQLRTIRNDKNRKRKELIEKRRQAFERKKKEETKWREEFNKEMRLHRYKGEQVKKRKRSQADS